MCKRAIDILISLIGIIIFMPFMIFISLFIKLDSKGPVLYLADRVGKGMKNFKMYKFRTMIDTPISVGDSVCPEYDPRVTTFGRFLRRMKFNELPQLLNILKGEMTFVGPRPEAPDLAELYPEEAKRVFSVKPGLVGPSTILGRNEEELYPPGVDAKKYYIEKILPKKVEIDLKYIKNWNLFKDLQYILMGVKETLVGALSKKHILDNRSQIYLFIADIFLIVCSYILAVVIFSRNFPGGGNLINALAILPLVIVILLACNLYSGMYNCLIRYISYHEILGILKGVTSGSLFLVLIAWAVGSDYYSEMIVIMHWILLIFTLSGLRIGLKLYREKMIPESEIREKRKILIFGAGDEGRSAYHTLTVRKNSPFEVVGFIDDAPNKYGKKLNGLKILGNRHHIKALAQLYKVEEIILAQSNANPELINEVVKICQKAGLKYQVFPSPRNIDAVSRHTFPVRTLTFTDMLPPERIHMDCNAVKRILADKTVLVNGSGGALGMELCHQILQLGCRKLIIVDRYESYLNELLISLISVFSHDLIIPVVLDTDKTDTLEQVFENHQPDIVFHASMRKYVPFLTLNIDNVGQVNYVRTFNLAKIASKSKCKLFVMISSLLAAQNGNPIADSLRVAEVSLEHFFDDTHTRLIIARICDVIENRGGIISIIEDQIREHQAVTLPSADTKAYLMSKYSATRFILQTLVEANELAQEKRVFNCKPSLHMPLVKVASKLADLYGLKLKADLPIKYIVQSKEHADPTLKNISSSASIYSPSIKDVKLNTGNTSEKLKSVFKNFVLADNNKLALEDWKTQTRELIKLCGSDIFLSEP